MGLVWNRESDIPGGSTSAPRMTPLVNSIRKACDFWWVRVLIDLRALAMDPRASGRMVIGRLNLLLATSTGCGRGLRQLLWFSDIGCSERRGRLKKGACGLEVPVDTSVLRKRDTPSRELLGAPIRSFQLVCA